jgi:hypothetical protein
MAEYGPSVTKKILYGPQNVRSSAMTLDNICEKFGINQIKYQFQDSTDVSKVKQLYTRLRRKDGYVDKER